MGPQHPETSDLRGEKRELLFDSSNNGTSTPVSGKKRWRILTLEGVRRVARESMCKEATMDVE